MKHAKSRIIGAVIVLIVVFLLYAADKAQKANTAPAAPDDAVPADQTQNQDTTQQ